MANEFEKRNGLIGSIEFKTPEEAQKATELFERIQLQAQEHERIRLSLPAPCGKHPCACWIPGPHPDDDYCQACQHEK
jgi:hypothetical protein